MKLSGINLSDVKFTSGVSNKKDESLDINKTGEGDKHSNSSKKIVLALSALAVAGMAVVALRKGKAHPEGSAPVKTTIQTPPAPTPANTPASTTLVDPINTLSKEGKDVLDKVRKVFGEETVVSPETIDRTILISTSEQNPELVRLNEYFTQEGIDAEKLHEENKLLKNKIRKALSTPTEPDSQFGSKIDDRMQSMSADVRSRMTDFYTNMEKEAVQKAQEAKRIEEARQAKKEAMLKLKAENPEEYNRLKKERINAQKLAHKAKRASQIISTSGYNRFYETTTVTTPTANGKVSREYINSTGQICSEVRLEKDKVVRTTYDKFGKSTYISINNYDKNITKHYDIDKNGKYRLVSKEIDFPSSNTTITVEHLDDGLTKITTEDPDTRKIVVRDKKGNVLSQKLIDKTNHPEPPKAVLVTVLADWYKHYLSLCKSFGVTPRNCGYSGGAFDHYYELRMRECDREAYNSYLLDRRYRSKYNDKAQVLELLDKLDSRELSVPLLDSQVLKLEKLLENTELPEDVVTRLKNLISETKACRRNLAPQVQTIFA